MSERAIEFIHSDGSRTRYEADRGGFVLVTDRERVGVTAQWIQTLCTEHLFRMAFRASREETR